MCAWTLVLRGSVLRAVIFERFASQHTSHNGWQNWLGQRPARAA